MLRKDIARLKREWKRILKRSLLASFFILEFSSCVCNPPFEVSSLKSLVIFSCVYPRIQSRKRVPASFAAIDPAARKQQSLLPFHVCSNRGYIINVMYIQTISPIRLINISARTLMWCAWYQLLSFLLFLSKIFPLHFAIPSSCFLFLSPVFLSTLFMLCFQDVFLINILYKTC